MKLAHKLSIFMIFIFGLQSQLLAQINGNGHVTKEERKVSPFTSIITSDGWDLVLTQGEKHSLVIETDENLIDHVRTVVEGNTLKIYSKGTIRKSKKRKIHLTFENLDFIKASGGSDIEATSTITSTDFELDLSGGSDLENFSLHADELDATFTGGSDAYISFETIDHITLSASGGSDVSLKNIDAKSCDIHLSGGSDATLSGSVNDLIIVAQGGSDVSATGLQVEDCELNLAGSSDAEMHVSGNLKVTLGGGSDLSCKGSPKVTHKSICKSCDMTIR